MSGLPSANNDPLVPKLRDLTNTIYNPIFLSFTKLQEIISSFSNNLNHFNNQYQNKTSKILYDDINWAKESIDSDFTNLKKIENHVKFLNADETLTNQKEIIGIFIEFTDFFQDMILTNLEEVLKGCTELIINEDIELKNCFKLNNFELIEIINILKKYKIVVNVLNNYFKNIDQLKFTNKLDQNSLNLNDFNELKLKVDKISTDLNSVINNLNNL